MKNVICQVLGEDSGGQHEIEVYRVGKYEEGGARHLQVKFNSQITIAEMLNRSWKLASSDDFKTVYIRKDHNEEKRTKIGKLLQEVKEKSFLKFIF